MRIALTYNLKLSDAEEEAEFDSQETVNTLAAAIERLGARFEGILRQHQLVRGGQVRDSAYYSILDTEWPEVKARLEARLVAR